MTTTFAEMKKQCDEPILGSFFFGLIDGWPALADATVLLCPVEDASDFIQTQHQVDKSVEENPDGGSISAVVHYARRQLGAMGAAIAQDLQNKNRSLAPAPGSKGVIVAAGLPVITCLGDDGKGVINYLFRWAVKIVYALPQGEPV
jgi:hypothetical protein